ncbi:High-affnity carbon uptake protein Hat/HatR [Methanosarcina siciliae HI350]|uniref:High-affnity carbon uptake protein Hat/HatR n=1 Tax=Methanosarcina siciliae HI350 TaxID=1434119 RepID=A0A0E3PDR1_9EURY|nr:tetratricopeptide repeat protein [Methanosarcina siciliae]AKB32639.1 High-affnity carbon uptake protein Hat/HatR [Methanosarcina siciliae HI350]
MELDPSHLMKIEEIVTLLDLSDDCTIAFVRCNEPVLCDAICKEIFERVHSRIHIYKIEMNEESTDLFQILEETTKSDSYNSKLEENKKIAFFVFGLDNAVEKKNVNGNSETLLLLNMMREKFLEIKHPILIWINSASLNLILEEAQDFFSWRTTIFEFDIKREITPSPMFEFGDFNGLDKKGLEGLIEYYSNLIKEFKDSGIKDPYKFAYWNYNLGTIKLFFGYSKEALKYLDTAESISSKLDNKYLKESIYRKLGTTYIYLGDSRKAIEYYEQALKISREIGDRRGEGNHLGNLGITYHYLGDSRKEIEYFEQALKILRETGDRYGEGTHLGNLGITYHYLGEPRKAIEYYEQALKISREIGDRRGEGNHLGNLGNAYSDLGEPRKAIEYFEQALKISREIGDRRGEGADLGSLGKTYNYLGDSRKAIEYYEQALKISRELGDRRGEGNHLGNLGLAYSDLGEPRKAIEFLEQSLAIGKAIEDPRIIRICEQNLKKLEGSDE